MKRWKLYIIMLAVSLSFAGCSGHKAQKEADIEGLTIYEEKLAVPGLEEEFTFFFMADTHISICDERDSALSEKAASRYEMFRNAQGEGAEVSFCDMLDYAAEQKPRLLILGGDITDSAMWASIDLVSDKLEETNIPWIYMMGNHDFEYGSEYFSNKCYEEYLPRFRSVSNTEDGYQFVEYENFIIFAADDNNNQVTQEALTAFKEVYEADKPIIHTGYPCTHRAGC